MAIKLKTSNGAIDLSAPVVKGIDGGYYIPNVDLDGNLSWTPVRDTMPAVPGANIKGTPGDKGESGVYIGTNPGEDDVVWIDPTDGEVTGIITKEEVQTMIDNATIKPDLTGYATEQYVDDKVAAIVIPEGAAKDSFFVDFTNATTTGQDCNADMLEFIEYFLENDDCCLNIRDGLDSGSGYYYPALIQSTNKASSINILKAVVNLNTINNENEFRIYNFVKSNGVWQYKYLLTTYTYQFVTAKNINNFLKDYQTEDQVKALITAELGVIENGSY